MDILRGVVLAGAALTTGLMAGVFAIFSNAIMPGLRRTDDRTFVGSFQAIDRAIVNPLFLSTFLGALLLSVLSAVLHVPGDERSVLAPTLVASLLYSIVVVTTLVVNVPRNDELQAAGDPDDLADLDAVRRRFDERRWSRWNSARALMSFAAFACLIWGLVEFGANA